jgi:RimJ/RimL family protein N-acetyltransferase
MIVFYRREVTEEPDLAAGLPPHAEMRIWLPASKGPPPPGSRRLRNLVWWAFSRFGVFAGRGFAELSIWRDGRMAHRLIVTPRWYRFPFMDEEDLQIGDLWTHPLERRRGLARAAIAEAHRRFASRAGRFWYAVDARNKASISLIESCGYSFVGIGRRTAPFSIRMIGRFELEIPAA